MRTVDSGAPNLRSDRNGQMTFGGRVSPSRLARLRILPGLANYPVMVRLAIGLAFMLAIASSLAITATAVGPYTIPPSHILDIMAEQVGMGEASVSDTERAIVAIIRLPRIILALTVGAALGVSGAVMQGLFRNPMADPGIIGVSTGGALGAVIAISIGVQAVFPLALPAMSFAGAAGALALVYFVASVGGRFSWPLCCLPAWLLARS